ncbi:MAG: TonB-dependent receptor, partial [Ignavibacteriaceae bacterium]|nr:TonB-dependent receptor [Ignavibacteriaceae bacterium]
MKIDIYKYFLTFVILLLFFSVSSFAQIETQDIPKEFQKIISVELKNVTFEHVLNVISEKANIKLNYNRDRIPLEKIISVKMLNKTVEEVLNYVLDLTGTEFRIISGEQVLITPVENNKSIKGKIRGKVIDKETQRPLIGVNILIENYSIGAATDTKGEYTIDNMPVGGFTLRFSYVGYATIYEPDIIVRSNRITFVDAEMEETAIEGNQVIIKDNYFADIEIEQTSTSKFSTEEIRRAATIGGDISRIINGLPSLSNDNNMNNIIARGGSPIENGFYLDNIEIPNINHLPIPGSTGGLFSILNIDFVKNIDVYTGGFGAVYGDKLSSILDIKYREGNRSENDYQLDLNIAGMSAQAEGPLANGSGSWLVFARHSFTDLIIKLFDLKDDPLSFNEFQTKIVYDLTPNHQISFLDLLSYDKYEVSKRVALIDYSDYYGKFNITQNTAGINWKYLWNKNGYSNTSLSHLILKNQIPFYSTSTDSLRTRLATTENEFRLRNINFYNFNQQFRLQFGIEAKLLSGKYDNYFEEHFNRIGVQIPETYVNKNIVTSKFGGFATLEWIPSPGLKIKPGARIDYFSFNNNLHISPRFSFSYQIGRQSVFTGSAGVFYQNLPMYYLSNNDQFKSLKDPVCYHFVLGYNFLFTEDLRLSVEIYDKE